VIGESQIVTEVFLTALHDRATIEEEESDDEMFKR
jgi:hypothetical protein